MSSDFKPFEAGPSSDFSGKQDYVGEDFRISKNLSQAIVENPGLKELLEEEVSKRLNSRLQEDNSTRIQSFFEEGKREGHAAGIEEGRASIEAFKKKLEKISEELLLAKKNLLHDHEEQWCRALKQVLEKCFVGRAEYFTRDVSQWLLSHVESIAEDEALKVIVSAAEYEAFQKEWEIAKGSGVKFEASSDLHAGEIRFKTEAGEMFFSSDSALKKLDEIIDNHFSKDKNS